VGVVVRWHWLVSSAGVVDASAGAVIVISSIGVGGNIQSNLSMFL